MNNKAIQVLKQLDELITKGEIITKPNWGGNNPRKIRLETKDGVFGIVPEETNYNREVSRFRN